MERKKKTISIHRWHDLVMVRIESLDLAPHTQRKVKKLKYSSPVHQNMTLFGDRVFTEIIKLKRGH